MQLRGNHSKRSGPAEESGTPTALLDLAAVTPCNSNYAGHCHVSLSCMSSGQSSMSKQPYRARLAARPRPQQCNKRPSLQPVAACCCCHTAPAPQLPPPWQLPWQQPPPPPAQQRNPPHSCDPTPPRLPLQAVEHGSSGKQGSSSRRAARESGSFSCMQCMAVPRKLAAPPS